MSFIDCLLGGSGRVNDSDMLTNGCKFMDTLSGILWQFIAARPANPLLAPACLPGEIGYLLPVFDCSCMLMHVVLLVCARECHM